MDCALHHHIIMMFWAQALGTLRPGRRQRLAIVRLENNTRHVVDLHNICAML